jgi:hypothetical protein
MKLSVWKFREGVNQKSSRWKRCFSSSESPQDDADAMRYAVIGQGDLRRFFERRAIKLG